MYCYEDSDLYHWHKSSIYNHIQKYSIRNTNCSLLTIQSLGFLFVANLSLSSLAEQIYLVVVCVSQLSSYNEGIFRALLAVCILVTLLL